MVTIPGNFDLLALGQGFGLLRRQAATPILTIKAATSLLIQIQASPALLRTSTTNGDEWELKKRLFPSLSCTMTPRYITTTRTKSITIFRHFLSNTGLMVFIPMSFAVGLTLTNLALTTLMSWNRIRELLRL